MSHYNHNLEQLDFVQADVTDMRNYLLTEGGFDTVYEVRDANVSRQVIDDFMGKYFSGNSALLGPEDRLLFYYSGHGGAQNGAEPFLLFQNADPSINDFRDALRVRDVDGWAKTIVAKHLLIILDSCFSGQVDAKPGPDDATFQVASALAGEPSGVLLTAGTGDEKAYAVQYSKERKGSIFTHALIDALQNTSISVGITTIGQAFEQAKAAVVVSAAAVGKSMHPHRSELARKDGTGKGSFLFINPKAQNPMLPPRIPGRGPTIAKTPDDPGQMLLDFERVNGSGNREAMLIFVSSYEAKAYGQTLVAWINEQIKQLPPIPFAGTLPIGVFGIEAIPHTDASKLDPCLNKGKFKIVPAQGTIRVECPDCDHSGHTLMIWGVDENRVDEPPRQINLTDRTDRWGQACRELNGGIYSLLERKTK